MRKYNSIFKEKSKLTENNSEWEEFVNFMQSLWNQGKKVSIMTKNAEFFTKMKDLYITADLEAVMFTYSKDSSGNTAFMIQPKNFSHFEDGPNKVIVFSKGNGSFTVTWG